MEQQNNRSNSWDLAGKRALITGGTRGIGEATAREFRSLGAEVIVVARSCSGDDAITCDITDPNQRAHLLSAITARWGALDILVNNAGTNIRKPWVEMSGPEEQLVMRTNLHAPTALLREFHPLLKMGNGACVVNIASVAGYVDVGSGSAYALSKGAIIQFTRSLAVEWAKDGIRVNSVSPWYIRTPLTKPVLDQPERLEKILDHTPLQRVGDPREVAAAIAFLSMDNASYITGHDLVVDGGFLCQGM